MSMRSASAARRSAGSASSQQPLRVRVEQAGLAHVHGEGQAFAEVRTLEELIDETFDGSRLFIIDEGFDFFRRWRKAGEIQ